jgi:hypothetical protein
MYLVIKLPHYIGLEKFMGRKWHTKRVRRDGEISPNGEGAAKYSELAAGCFLGIFTQKVGSHDHSMFSLFIWCRNTSLETPRLRAAFDTFPLVLRNASAIKRVFV